MVVLKNYPVKFFSEKSGIEGIQEHRLYFLQLPLQGHRKQNELLNKFWNRIR